MWQQTGDGVSRLSDPRIKEKTMLENVMPNGAMNGPEDEPKPDELRALIARTGLSQRRAAEAIDVSERMMRYYASGQEKIPRAVLYALRYLAGVPPRPRG
jgi:hypothetical protein